MVTAFAATSGASPDDGYLFTLHRRADLIISGGESISPSEIGAVLQSHPAGAGAGTAAE
jgi:acyl-CoA synthetase (AMP-forming)/AMP-acid ligase II